LRPFKESNRTLIKSNLHYSLKFASIISPGSLFNFQITNSFSNTKKTQNYKKLYVKQSYMILTWILYLKTSLNQNQKKFKKTNLLPSFFVLPKTQKKLTIIKSPMAHKTFSQEQYLFKFYTLVVSYSLFMDKDTAVNTPNTSKKKISSLNSSLLFILKHRNLSPLNLGTNLLFTKKLISYSTWRDPSFLKFF